MSDAPAKSKTFRNAMEGVAVIVIGMSLIFAGAAFGWHAGVALARVLGL